MTPPSNVAVSEMGDEPQNIPPNATVEAKAPMGFKIVRWRTPTRYYAAVRQDAPDAGWVYLAHKVQPDSRLDRSPVGPPSVAQAMTAWQNRDRINLARAAAAAIGPDGPTDPRLVQSLDAFKAAAGSAYTQLRYGPQGAAPDYGHPTFQRTDFTAEDQAIAALRKRQLLIGTGILAVVGVAIWMMLRRRAA